MKKILFLFIIATLILSSCKKGDTIGELDLTFTTKTQDGNLVLFEDFNLADGTLLNLNKLQFFISDIRLIDGNSETKIADIDLVSFKSHDNATAAQAGETLTFGEIPTGSYTGIKFGLGVSSDLNGETPDYYAGVEGRAVLADAGNHWVNWESYIHTKVEGFFDANGNGTAGGGDADESITYHTGMDMLYREKTINMDISIGEDGTFRLPLTLDIDKIFDSASSLDLPNEPVAHSNPTNAAFMTTTTKVADNLVEAISK